MVRRSKAAPARTLARWSSSLSFCCVLACGSSEQNEEPGGSGDAGTPGAGSGGVAAGGMTSAVGGTTISGGQGSQPTGGTATGATGSSATGGTQAGGAAAGGASSGTDSGGATSSAGGSASGGTSTGGESTGGAATGGEGTGGLGTGGRGTGGEYAGGRGSGGRGSGGRSMGGQSTGGQATGGGGTGGGGTGGESTGGAATGGSATGGSGDSSGVCPPGITKTITVAKDGSGQFDEVQAAVDSIASNSSEHIRIDIKAGTYREKLTIASRRNLCLVGEDATRSILTYDDSNAKVGSTSGSASVLVSADDFSATQLTFQNSYGSGSQAVALRTTGQRQQFLECRFVAYQDTLYVHEGTQYFRDCYVQGNTDYVFGHATAILENCEVRNVEKGSAVAAPNTEASSAYGIVFLGGHFTAASGISGVALARPWGADGAAAFLNATLDGHISASGFTSMSGNDPANARFREYQSTGAGANASARSSYQMPASEAANYTVSKIYGGAWTPSYSP
jgi:pectin methylesterase-like acyl-CoA thioesterase